MTGRRAVAGVWVCERAIYRCATSRSLVTDDLAALLQICRSEYPCGSGVRPRLHDKATAALQLLAITAKCAHPNGGPHSIPYLLVLDARSCHRSVRCKTHPARSTSQLVRSMTNTADGASLRQSPRGRFRRPSGVRIADRSMARRFPCPASLSFARPFNHAWRASVANSAMVRPHCQGDCRLRNAPPMGGNNIVVSSRLDERQAVPPRLIAATSPPHLEAYGGVMEK